MDSAFSVHVGLFFGLITSTNFQLIDRSEYCTEINDERICYSQGSAKALNWAEAYQICSDTNTTLPIIRNEEEKTSLHNYFEYLKGKVVNLNSAWLSGRWIGFRNWTWVNGRKLQENLNIYGGSSQTEEEALYAVLTDKLVLIPGPSYYPIPYLCQTDGQCKDGIGIQLTNSCLIQKDGKDSWHDARLVCIDEEGDLAVLNNQDMDILKNRTLWKNRNPFNWIGLRKGSWFWTQTPSNMSGDEDVEVKNEELKYYKWGNNGNTIGKDRCISSRRSTDLWSTSPCNAKQSVICQRRVGLYTNAGSLKTTSFINMPTGTNVFVLGLALVGVLLFIAIGVIVGLVIRGKTIVSRMESSSDGKHQDTKRTHDINTNRERSGYYDEIGIDNSGYESLRTSQIHTYLDIIDNYEDIDSQLEDTIE